MRPEVLQRLKNLAESHGQKFQLVEVEAYGEKVPVFIRVTADLLANLLALKVGSRYMCERPDETGSWFNDFTICGLQYEIIEL